jgi:quercetin dioxygenase-like cupin family protein
VTEALRIVDEHPEIVEGIHEIDGVYFRIYSVEKPFVLLPQHAHDHTHATIICSGSVRLWRSVELVGDFHAGDVVEIKAGEKHHFQTLQPRTRIACVHSIESAQSIKDKECR